jgi:cytochrome c oxidase subunit 3
MTESTGVLAHQFDDAAQQRAAADTGMWVFIAGEILFFGVLFFAYAATRIHFPEAFAAAGRRTDVVLGTVNTALLLTSSFTMALAVHAAELRRGKSVALLLGATFTLGALFLGIKFLEYSHDYQQHLVPALNFSFAGAQSRGAELFFYLYFVMTGFHALHLTVGMCIVAALALKVWSRSFRRYLTALALVALYWHLVDIVWIFLYPLLYLVGRA